MENRQRQRLERVREAMAALEIPAMLVCKKENKLYLSGFCSTSYYVVITQGEGFLLTDSRYIEAAQTNPAGLTPVLLKGENTLSRFLKDLSVSSLAVEEEEVSVAFYKALSEKLRGTALVSALNILEGCRMIKDQEEIALLRQAEAIGDQAYSHILGFIREGVREKELALELELYMRKRGAQGLSFETICASGPRSSLPHGTATDRRLQTGDFITFDFGCVYEGYCSDMTRTVALGEVSRDMEQVYQIVLEAQKAGIEAVCGGKSCEEVDRAARDVIKYYGYEAAFGHGLGHGVGLEIHEAPTLNPASTGELRENMAVTVEPGIYLAGKFGVRIEDLVIVKKDGCEILSSSDKALTIINGG